MASSKADDESSIAHYISVISGQWRGTKDKAEHDVETNKAGSNEDLHNAKPQIDDEVDAGSQPQDLEIVGTGVTQESDGDDSFYDCSPLEDETPERALRQSQSRASAADDEKLPNKAFERMSNSRCCGVCLKRFPRTCAVVVGVVLPLFVLILFSLAFGTALCEYEAPPEFHENDFKLARQYFANISTMAIVNLTMDLPRVCFTHYLSEANNTDGLQPLPVDPNITELIRPILTSFRSHSSDALPSLLVPDRYEAPFEFDPETIIINATEFYLYVTLCGQSGEDLMSDLLRQTIENSIEASEPLTFNWIRCFENADSGDRNYNGEGLDAKERSVEGQSVIYTDAWEQDREELFNEYYNQFLEDGVDPVIALANASIDAANDATGRHSCELNAPAAAWFWFTVQTTVGYGNTPPTTTESRAMVYTVGFVSILAFGGVLAAGGYILSYLFDDFVVRYGMAFLSKPWVGCLLWGGVYYLWMLLIAQYTILWKKRRLDEDFDLRDAYWFAYISTTTVGFGDFYLEPEGIIGSDLVVFPLLFLIGFMYVAAFIGKLAELIMSLLRKNRKSFVDSLLETHVGWSEALAVNCAAPQ